MTQPPQCSFQPAYLRHPDASFLASRIEELRSVLSDCTLCQRSCHVDRLAAQVGACGASRHATASWSMSFADDFATVGGRGGAIFSGDNGLHCIYCDQAPQPTATEHQLGHRMDIDELAGLYRVLQDRGCTCLHWVSATADLPFLVAALRRAIERGLHLPIVYHTNGFDSPSTIEKLDGIVDSYQVELTYSELGSRAQHDGLSDRQSRSRSVLREMYQQIGAAWVRADDGSLLRGILMHVRVLPYDLAGLRNTLEWIANHLSRSAVVCLRAGARPHVELHGPGRHQSRSVTRPLTQTEWELARWTLEETLPNGRHVLLEPTPTHPWHRSSSPPVRRDAELRELPEPDSPELRMESAG
jgi:putative pyruvate formate lyase activating enzyme